jgi:prevent-host-death family protein
MEIVNVQEARRHISELLDRVVDGEEVIISRRGVPIARLSPVSARKAEFPDRRRFRASLPTAALPSSVTVRQLRDDERY